MAEYTSRAIDRTDGHRFHPANVCTRNFVFGHGKDRNRGGKHKAEAHILPKLFNSIHANTVHNNYGGYEGSNSKFSVSEPAHSGMINNSKLSVSEPTLIDSDGWVRPSRSGWAMPPEVPLSKVTHDVDAAAAYVRGSATVPEVPLMKMAHDVDTARGSERAQSAGLFGADKWSSATSSPYQTRRATATIDSKQAAKKYGGQFIW